MAQPPVDFFHKLPSNLDGWKKEAKPAVYTPENLSKYIDGGAELFISYNFKNLFSLKYIKDKDEEITIDIFDMGNSFNAFGVFAHSRESVDHQIGQDCEYHSGLLTFWQERYYVSILTYPETKEKKELVLKLGRLITAAIGRKGTLPPIIALLPPAKLVPESVRYFHHYIWLNSYYFVSNENILNIDDKTQATFGKYQDPTGAYYLLLVSYPDSTLAGKAQQNFLKQYLGSSSEGIRRMKDGRYSACKQNKNLLIIVLNAPSVKVAQTITTRALVQNGK